MSRACGELNMLLLLFSSKDMDHVRSNEHVGILLTNIRLVKFKLF